MSDMDVFGPPDLPDHVGHESPENIAKEASFGVQSVQEDVYGNQTATPSGGGGMVSNVAVTVAPAPRKVVSAGAIHDMPKAAPPPPRKTVSAGVTHLVTPSPSSASTSPVASKKKFNPASLLMTAGGTVMGFLLAGPVGAAAGAALGGGADFYRAHHVNKSTT